MTDVNPLTDAERNLLNQLAIKVCADQQAGKPGAIVAKELDAMIADGELEYAWDATKAYVIAFGRQVLVNAARDWLAMHAAGIPGYDPMKDARPIEGGGGQSFGERKDPE